MNYKQLILIWIGCIATYSIPMFLPAPQDGWFFAINGGYSTVLISFLLIFPYKTLTKWLLAIEFTAVCVNLVLCLVDYYASEQFYVYYALDSYYIAIDSLNLLELAVLLTAGVPWSGIYNGFSRLWRDSLHRVSSYLFTLWNTKKEKVI